jgi:hypothetical protein
VRDFSCGSQLTPINGRPAAPVALVAEARVSTGAFPPLYPLAVTSRVRLLLPTAAKGVILTHSLGSSAHRCYCIKVGPPSGERVAGRMY